MSNCECIHTPIELLIAMNLLHSSLMQIIQRTYKTHFGKDLIEDIRSETSGNFENLLVALLTPIVDYYVKELHDAMAGIGTDEDVLIEVKLEKKRYFDFFKFYNFWFFKFRCFVRCQIMKFTPSSMHMKDVSGICHAKFRLCDCQSLIDLLISFYSLRKEFGK